MKDIKFREDGRGNDSRKKLKKNISKYLTRKKVSEVQGDKKKNGQRSEDVDKKRECEIQKEKVKRRDKETE